MSCGFACPPACLAPPMSLRTPDSALSSHDSPSLVVLPIPAWLLANQLFIKPIQVTNLHSVQKSYSTALILL